MPSRKTTHLLEPLDRHQGRQRLALPLDDELVVSERHPVEHVSDSLANVHRRNLLWHCNSINYYSCSSRPTPSSFVFRAGNSDGYSSRSASTGATLDARSAGSNDAA